MVVQIWRARGVCDCSDSFHTLSFCYQNVTKSQRSPIVKMIQSEIGIITPEYAPPSRWVVRLNFPLHNKIELYRKPGVS